MADTPAVYVMVALPTLTRNRAKGKKRMDYFTTTSSAARRAAACIIVGVFEKSKLGSAATDLDKASGGQVRRLYRQGDVSGKAGSVCMVPGLTGVKADRVLLVGLGQYGKTSKADFRAAVTAATNALKSSRASNVISYLGQEAISDTTPYYMARYTAESIGDALYSFSEMKSGRGDKKVALKKVGFALTSRGEAKAVELGAQHGDGIVHGMTLTKNLGNLPPNVCTPSYLARQAQKMARECKKMTTKVLNEAEMKRLGMNSLLSVTAGAEEPAKLIIMQYKGAGSDKPLVLVGKGVTFDSGGISLKPGPGMDEMKFDMGGAASVFGAMAATIKLDLPVNLTVVVPACENMPSGRATRPGDIVKSMSGQTIEILNTDAEGRLILCDALTYSRRFKPAAIIDIATLTGACVIALGHHYSGVMSYSDELATTITSASGHADDKAWRLPLGEEYVKQLESNFADFANVGGRDGGTITAGCFLGKFTDGMNWAHIDIAGTAWRSGKAKGATGRPVPLLTQLVLDHSGALP